MSEPQPLPNPVKVQRNDFEQGFLPYTITDQHTFGTSNSVRQLWVNVLRYSSGSYTSAAPYRRWLVAFVPWSIHTALSDALNKH